MRIGITISLLLHAGILLWALISIGGAKPLDVPSIPMQVELLTVAELNDIRKGAERSKIKEPKPDESATKAPPAKPAEKPKKVATVEPPKQPEPEPPKPEPPKPEPPKPEPPKPEPPKPEPPKPEPPKPEPPKPDPIADALNKLPPEPEPEPKPEPKPEAKKPDKPKADAKSAEKVAEKPKVKPKPKATLAQLQRALLDKQPDASAAPAGESESDTKDNKKVFDEAFGAQEASGTKLSATEAAMLGGLFRRQVSGCWSLANGGLNADQLSVKVSVAMNQDGTVAGTPRVLNGDGSAMFGIAAENAVRAVLDCQPYKMPADLYEHWSAITVNFDPKVMFGQ